MIKNLFHYEPSVIKSFHESEFDFYISTVNFWKYHYFVKVSTKVEEFLFNLGFDRIEDRERNYYFDSDSSLLFRFKMTKGRELIVSLSSNPQLRNEIQILLGKIFPDGIPGTFEYKKQLWNDLFHFCYKTSDLSQSTRIV